MWGPVVNIRHKLPVNRYSKFNELFAGYWAPYGTVTCDVFLCTVFPLGTGGKSKIIMFRMYSRIIVRKHFPSSVTNDSFMPRAALRYAMGLDKK